MQLAVSFGLNSSSQTYSSVDPQPQVFSRLGNRNGFAIDFKSQQMTVRDSLNPANNFVGRPQDRLTKWGNDDWSIDPVRGLEISGARDFSIAVPTSSFPYNPEACTVYIKYRLNSATSTEQRYLVMADNAGTDRFATYAAANENFRFVTGDGITSDIKLTSSSPIADTEHVALFGADLNGKTYVDDQGIQVDANSVLATSVPSYFGIGGYPDRVLRVLDGFIAEIVVVCEPIERADRLSLEFFPPEGVVEDEPHSPVFDILGDRDGFAIDFVAQKMKVNDALTPERNFVGDPGFLLHNFGNDAFEYDPVRGLRIDAARDFSIGISTSLFPFNTEACTVYAKYRVNNETSPEQRYLFMIDNAGSDRFALYSTAGDPFRFATGDGVDPNISVSDMNFAPDTLHTIVFGADLNGKTFVDQSGVHADSVKKLETSVPAYVGIGGYNDRVLRVLDGYIAEMVVITEPMPRGARLDLAPFYTVYKAEGDSHTFNQNSAIWGVQPDQFYPARVADALGPRIISVNEGWSGDSTAEMVHQLPDFLRSGRPDIATIYAGSNDAPISIVGDTVPTATEFSVEPALASRLEVGGFVVVNGEQKRVASRVGNMITLDQPLALTPLVGDMITPDTQANLEYWVDEVRAKGVTKIAVIGLHFINFSNGGETPEQQHPSRSALRDKQRAAANSRNVPYIDTYSHMANKIINGEVVAGDDLSWHVDVGNTHLNVAGEQALADAVHDAFVSLGWLE